MNNRRSRQTLAVLVLVLAAASSQGQVFFEAARPVSPADSYHPLLLSTADGLYLFSQAVVGSAAVPQIQVQVQQSAFGREWTPPVPLGSPVDFIADTPPRIYDANWDGSSLLVVILEDQDRIQGYQVSRDGVRPVGQLRSESALVVPELSSLSSGGHLLIVAQQVVLAEEIFEDAQGNQIIERRAVQNLFASVTRDGTIFGRLEPLVNQDPVPGGDPTALEQETEASFLQINLSPVHVSSGGRELVVFQSRNDRTGRFHLWIKSGRVTGSGSEARVAWSPAARITDFVEPRASDPDTAGPLSFENESPDAVLDDSGSLRLAWERRQRPGGISRAAYMAYSFAELIAVTDTLQSPAEESGLVPDEFRYLDEARFPVDRPRFAAAAGREPVVFWTRDPFGNPRIAFRDLDSVPERVRDVVDLRAFNHSVVLHPDPDDGRARAHLAFESGQGGATRIVAAEPDQSADPPVLRALNFRADRRSPLSEAQIGWRPAPDASGIQAYSVTWTRDPNAVPPETPGLERGQEELSLSADADGAWYLSVRALDNAGNWSAPARIRFFRDTTPPPPVVLDRPVVDEDGFLASNTFSVGWQAPQDEDLAGYSLRWTRLGDERLDPPEEQIAAVDPGGSVQTSGTRFSRSNEDNGTWVLAVAPVDGVGNVGEARQLLVRLNKYVPVTIISRVEVREDFLGEPVLDVVGRGFTSDGTISRILLDADGQAPFDYVLDRQAGGYELASDRLISGISLAGIEAGTYRLILEHSTRGRQVAREQLTFDRRGLVRLGDFRVEDLLAVRFSERAGFILGADSLVIWIVLLLAVSAVVFAGLRIRISVREARQLRADVRRLISRQEFTAEEEERRQQFRHRGAGLRVKFAVLMVLVVVGVVAIVAIPLSVFSIQNQEQTLTEGLRSDVAVLMESIASSSRGLLQNPGGNIIALSAIPAQRSALSAARYVTITGLGSERSAGPGAPADALGFVWASDDPVLRGSSTDDAAPERGFADGAQEFSPGVSRISDPASDALRAWQEEIDREARERLGDIPARISELTRSLQSLVLAEFTAREAGNSIRATEIAAEIRAEQRERNELTVQLNSILREVVGQPRSVPVLESGTLSIDATEYLFYVPVVGRDPADDPDTARYSRGAVRMGVSTSGILSEIAASRLSLLERVGIAAAIGVAAGIAAALLIAYLVVVPILRLVDTVTAIRQTEDKEDLKSLRVVVPSRDELRILGQTLEDLAHKLGEDEKQAKEVKVGKEIQQAFIPLNPPGRTHGRTVAALQEGGIELFGYYEGASGVSGDYFDFQRISQTQWVFIKSDASGHGIPAGLIATMVATLFRSEIEVWKSRYARSAIPPGEISSLVGRINDLIAERDFKRFFATLFVPSLDLRSGRLRFCYAGDNEYRIYRAGERELRTVSFGRGETLPAAGMFETAMLPNGFSEREDVLHRGDVLALFTDGFEDSEYYFRDTSLARVQYPASEFSQEFLEAEDLTSAFNEDPGSPVARERFWGRRVEALLHAAFRGEAFAFRRTKGLADEELVIDFSRIAVSPESVALGLASAATLWRIQRNPHGMGERSVRVDRNIDAFLRRTFNLYDSYFAHPLPDRDPQSQYVEFSHLIEDEQPDDLTVLMVRRN